MKQMFGILILVGLLATPTLAQKVTIDYAHEYDFDSVKTFTYTETKDTNAPDGLTDGRIVDAIVGALKSGGLQQVDSGGDIYVTYHLSAKDNTVYNTTNFGYGGYHGGWGGWGGGMGGSTTTASTYTEGTLVVDAYDSSEKKMIWRGSGTVTVKEKPEKQAQQIQNILEKMGKKWDKILKGMGE